jgi:lipopolysaccharide/colanic/teichoic acid biosynthesis glycosyltransferase
LDLLGVVVVAVLVDLRFATHLLNHPEWLVPFGSAYVMFGWLFGSYTLLRLPRLSLVPVLVRLGCSALATLLVVVLAFWLLNLPVTFTLGHRRIQASLLLGMSVWALLVRLLLRRQTNLHQIPLPASLEMAEQRQQRLLPDQLPEDALSVADVPWANTLSVERQLKRAADVTVALGLLLITSPLIALVALLIWLEDGGPVIYTQARTGWLGETFQLYKLRTMQQSDPTAEANWTLPGDQRITLVGWFLRRVRIDELPQLLNVLRGDMSLIGPRPERPELETELEAGIPHYRKRHWMLPGLSGWAQVSAPYAGNLEEAELKLSYDLYYLRHWSTAFDLLILLKTIKTVLKARGR